MGNLTLVRHGQARPFDKNSDRLSETGERQSLALGQYWVREGVGFDEVYAGALTRHRRTAEIVGQCFETAGLDWPSLQSIPELNEYDADGMLNRLVPALAERDRNFAQLLAAFEQNKGSADRNRYFQKMFEVVTLTWLSGEIEVEGVEPYPAFRSRVRGAIKRLTETAGGGRRIAIFTSGGVIGLSVQTALSAPEPKALEINWRVRNCSLTELIFSRGRISLDSFNSIPHLDDPALRTYR